LRQRFEHVGSLEALADLTDNPLTIRTSSVHKDETTLLIVRFSMRTAAQYKVIGWIVETMKFEVYYFADYLDMTVRFPG
jgi:hypothetical protein